MSKRLIMILALLFVVGLTCAAYAEVQNVKVSGDIEESALVRDYLTLRKNVYATDYGSHVSGFLSQIRVRIDADLTDNVSTTVRLLNERTWGTENNANTDIDLDLAYATMKEFLYSPLTLTIGRQELRFGNGLIIGDPDTNAIMAAHTPGTRILPKSIDDLSKRKSFDAIRATLNYDPLVVDLVYSKINQTQINADTDIDLYGINAGYALRKDLNIEGYYWERDRNVAAALGDSTVTTALSSPEHLRVAGARVAYTGVKDITLGIEGALQFGNHVRNATVYPNDKTGAANTKPEVHAWALQAMGSYALPSMTKYSPVIGGSYTYLSGDDYLSDKSTYYGWDPMFEDQFGGTLFNKIFQQTNMQIVNLNASMKPKDDLKVALNWYYLMLNEPYNDAATAVVLSGISGDPSYKLGGGTKSLGNEFDLKLTYDYTEDVQLGLNGGIFVPSEIFKGPTEGTERKSASQLIGSMKVTF